LEKKRTIVRIRRILSKVDDDAVKAESAALHAIFIWLKNAAKYRTARDDHIKAKKAAGKESEEEYEEDEENDDEEKDRDEEIVRHEEIEEQKRMEAEKAAENNEEEKEE
jgi:hypothetical protein